MCAKCMALQNSFMGRYGALIKAYQDGTYDPDKKYVDDEEECEDYKKMKASSNETVCNHLFK